MNSIRKRVLFIILLSTVFFAAHSPAFAEFQIRPDKIEVKKLNIKPGEKIADFITVHNDSDKDALIKAYFEDLAFTDGLKATRPFGSTAWSCGKWVSLTPSSFIVPAKKKR